MATHAASPSSQTAPLAAVMMSMLSITVGASIAKSLFPLVGPAGTTALRLVFAAAMLSAAFGMRRATLDRRTLAAAIPYGVSLGGMNLLFYMAIQRLPLGIAIAIEFTGPLAIALLSTRRYLDLGWIALAVAGLSMLIPLRAAHGAIDPVGVLLSLGAGLFWASYILTGKRAGDALGIRAPAFGMIVASILILPFGIAGAGSALLDSHVLIVGLAVALLSSAIPYTLEMFALRRLPAKSFGILTSVEPALGALVGVIFLGEAFPPVKWLGIGAVILASIGTTQSASADRGEAAEASAL